MKRLDACWFGRVSYGTALKIMEHFVAQVAGGGSEVLLLMEHPPVVTMGRSASEEHLLLSREEYARRGFELHRIGRGGDVTYHGPGQLMGYPIVNVGRMVTKHVDTMFDVVREMLLAYGIESAYEVEHPGLWVGTSKVAAVGVEIREGVSMHGFALNAHRVVNGFELIIPCGLSHRGTIYMSELAKVGPLESLAEEFAERYSVARREALSWLAPDLFARKHHIEHLLRSPSA